MQQGSLIVVVLVAVSMVLGVPQGKRGASSFTPEQIAFQNEALAEHNKLRKKHCTPDLVLDDTLSQAAQLYAEGLVKLGKMEHSGGDLGENLYTKKSSGSLSSVKGVDATNGWYKEIKDYDQSNPGYSDSTGHFTQVVWKGSKKAGFGIAFNADRSQAFVVAQYDPAGNVDDGDEFKNNVLEAKCS